MAMALQLRSHELSGNISLQICQLSSNILLDLAQNCPIMIDASVLWIGTTMTHALVYTLCPEGSPYQQY
ncbi:hypothetical protein CFP56_027436 [Quercus suber]|uniref:Uncharacterized protein n=1 Tax=Quercus suber TaxID=58331 RepID=A0AAW0JXJ1_QUESU